MQQPPTPLQIDIVSDVVCPWCIIGFKQLEQAMAATGLGAYVRWHPFELNPQMPPEGQNLREHLAEKYGTTPEQSRTARQRLTELGAGLGFAFNYSDEMRMVNTFAAHQLLDWASEHNLQHPLKLALFAAFFTDGKDVSDPSVLAEIAGSVGLDADAAREVLASGSHVERTREKLKGVEIHDLADHGYREEGAAIWIGRRRHLDRGTHREPSDCRSSCRRSSSG